MAFLAAALVRSDGDGWRWARGFYLVAKLVATLYTLSLMTSLGLFQEVELSKQERYSAKYLVLRRGFKKQQRWIMRSLTSSKLPPRK